jgi:hypothetical protein
MTILQNRPSVKKEEVSNFLDKFQLLKLKYSII